MSFRYLHPQYFLNIRIRAIIVVIILYPQIGNEPILNVF
jgi:hypothetical protein